MGIRSGVKLPLNVTTRSVARSWRMIFGLQIKFTLLVVGLALTVGAIVGAITIDFAAMLVNRLHADHCRQTANGLAQKAAAEYGGDGKALQKLAEQTVRTDPLLFVSFMDSDNRLLVTARNGKATLPRQDTEGITPSTTIGSPLFVSQANGGYLDITYPVRKSDADASGQSGDVRSILLGYVRMGFSLERTLAEVASLMEMLTGIAVLIGAMTVPLGFLVVRRMVVPLRELSRAMSLFADGDLGARCRINRTDEIGELAGAYNLMADKLAQKHREISELNAKLEERVQQRTRQLRELAARDPLTGLYNRRHFSEVLAQRFAEAKRYGTELSCMMIDLDNFKAVNDRYGHQKGDELLILVGITIVTELRLADVAARYGGDEFIVLLPQTDLLSARTLGERTMSKLSEAVTDQFPGCPVTISVGIGCMVDVGTEDSDDLIRAADKALYDAKMGGKNTIAIREVPV